MANAMGSLARRNFATFLSLRSSLAEPLKASQMQTSHHGVSEMWKKLFYFVCLPSILIAYANVAMTEEPPRPEFKKYAHLRIRNRLYPWGTNKSLFHNPHVNALPDGYEDGH